MIYNYDLPPVGGLKLDLPNNLLKNIYSPHSNGMWVQNGVLSRIPGKLRYSDTLLDGPIMMLYEFLQDTGDSYLLAVTNRTVYKFNPTTRKFESIQDGTEFLTSEDEQYAVESFVDGNADEIVIISNMVDAPRKWDGGTATIEILGGQPPKAKSYCVFANHLIAAHVVSGGERYPRRVMYSSLSNGESWPAENFFDLKEDNHPIVLVKRIGARAAIYKEFSISLLSYVGGANDFDLDEGYVGDKGSVNQDSLVVHGEGFEAHFFITPDLKVYRFDGVECVPISGAIDPHLYNINPEFKHRIVGQSYPQENKIVWAVPYDVHSTNKDLFIYDVTDQSWWMKQAEPIAISSFGIANLEETYTWDTLPYDSWDTWDDPGGWDSRHLTSGAKEALVGGHDGYVRQWVQGVDDDGYTIPSEYRYPFDAIDGRFDRKKVLTRVYVEMINNSDLQLDFRIFINGNSAEPVVLRDDGARRITVDLAIGDNKEARTYQAIDVYVIGYSFQFCFQSQIAWGGRVVAAEYEYDGIMTEPAEQLGATWQGDPATWQGERVTW